MTLHLPWRTERRGGNHRTGEPAMHLIERVGQENAAETTTVMRAIPAPRAVDTQPLHPVYLLHFGDPETVFQILGGRGLIERPAPHLELGLCEWNCDPASPATVLITGDREHTESCGEPGCYHEALRWVDMADDNDDRDLVVEHASRDARSLAVMGSADQNGGAV